jgi:hypothetical protein
MLTFGFSPVSNSEVGEPSPFGEAQTIEEYVRDYFSDIPVLAEVAHCESTFRHYGEDGNIIRGVVNNLDVGVMQINEYYHGDTANRLDLDLYTLEGNLSYARSLYEREGTVPWSASEFCWGNKKLALN